MEKKEVPVNIAVKDDTNKVEIQAKNPENNETAKKEIKQDNVIVEEKEKLPEQKQENVEEENKEGIKSEEDIDYKKLFFSQPSQKDKVKKDFTEYTRIDMPLLNKKREREKEKDEDNKNENEKNEENNDKKEEKEVKGEKEKEVSTEEKKPEEKAPEKKEEKEEIIKVNEEKKKPLKKGEIPEEVKALIEKVKKEEPLTAETFEKYKTYKKLSLNGI